MKNLLLSNIFVCFDWSLAVSLTIVFMWKRPFSDVTILLLMIDWTLVKWWFDFSISVWCHSYISWWYPYSTRKQNLADQCFANKNGSSTNASIPFANKKAYEALTRRLAISAPMVERTKSNWHFSRWIVSQGEEISIKLLCAASSFDHSSLYWMGQVKSIIFFGRDKESGFVK